ncbi:bifunctional glutamate N-acetyltransferase/amino-acid acetyltransferase ArgJ [Acidobacteriia bacterium AH_259_A11_L15]|nr:bifunctional glutamate N-acetyltransferase/amino-acid acetyltransferase ArgJ [Acidobacteriia bacterium AH_259_A11_L15]
MRLPGGFRFAGVAAGLKGGGALDLGLAEAPGGASAAAVFTSNRVVAAPLEVDRRHLRAGRGRIRAVIVNSGNANCATRRGRQGSERVCRELGWLLGIPSVQVFPASTGVIGVELPVGKIVRALPRLLSQRRGSAGGVRRFARAILTTDTRPKLAAAGFRCGRGRATLLGVAKGAGMIHPRLRPALRDFPRLRAGQVGGQARLSAGGHATMLAYLFTDVEASAGELQGLLAGACGRTFNRISVDGDTSTNDTVLLLASGASGLRARTRVEKRRFAAALEAVCASLAEQIVADGEGVGHVVRLRVEGARSPEEAERVARAIARSPLVKTAWAGADANWGRVLAAVGASGAPIHPGRVDIFLGPQQVCRRGKACAFAEGAAHRYLSRPRFEVRVRLGRGRAVASFLTCDLTTEYVRINAHYRT